MMKRMTLLAALLCAALTLSGCQSQSNLEYYERAQLYLGSGNYDYAAELFSQLGEYEDSADYALYSRALKALAEEDYELARADLEAVNPFKSSGRYLMYLDAIAAEAEDELEQALSLYEKLGTFCDANLAVERLETAIPEAAIQEGRALMNKGEYEAAREIFLSLDGFGASKALADNCTAAMNRAAYEAAEKLQDAGDLNGAMSAFTAMGDALDAKKRAAECLAAIHAELDKQYAAVTLANAPALMEAYAALDGDETAAARAAELTARFGRNLALITMEHPVLALGSYPAAENGQEAAVRWQIVKTENAKLTLLSEQVLDACETAQTVPVVFTEREAAAAGEVMLPAMAELAALPGLSCGATPYALAQGAAIEDGQAVYWLRDSLENGLHPVISGDGALTLPTAGMTPGIRLLMTLDLEKITFTSGSGTAEDPFRAE